MRKIFLDKLPQKLHAGNMCVDWINSVGYKFNFIYDEIEGEIEIIDYDKRTQIVKIKYNNKKYETRTGILLKCNLGRILNKKTSDFKIEIGTIIKDDKRDMTIIDREYRPTYNNDDSLKQKEKWYKYHCNICNYEGWKAENYLINKRTKCKMCASSHGVLVIKGVNDIATTHPYLVEYFKYKEDSYKYSFGSSKELTFICPKCKFERKVSICNLVKRGFICPKCSDGISYPEKLMSNLLFQLKNNKKINDFIYQYTKTSSKWCENYRYDFYFKLNNEEYIIETNGLQHYEENTNFKMSLKEVQENDKNKYELAIHNGIKQENYIVIDCRKSELDFIKNNIANSKLNEIFDLNKVDWVKIGVNSEQSLVIDVCNFWNRHEKEMTTLDVSKIFKVNRNTIVYYLKSGSVCNLLNNPYNGKEEVKKGIMLKQQCENNHSFKDIYLYNYETKELLYKGNFQKDIGKWIFENGLVNSVDTGKKLINNIIKRKNGVHKFKNGLNIVVSYEKLYLEGE